jgi:acetyl esterase/lipase
LTGEVPLPAPVHDAARAIQFIRSKAKEWNIDKDRIALTGGSAGACTSMWILLHDDLADPKSDDPVKRESTRVTAAAVSAGQTSIDPKVIEGWLGPNVLKHRMINMAVGESTIEGALANYEKHKALYVEFSPYNHLSKDDPPLLMTYGNNMTLPSENAGHGIHHPVYGVKMKEKADELKVECHLLIPGVSESDKYKTADEFLMDKLLGGKQ